MNFGSLLGFTRPLGHLVWWTAPGPPSQNLPAALEEALRTLLAVPLLEKSGVWWLPPDFDREVQILRDVSAGWELHTAPVRATDDTLEGLRASAQRFVEQQLGTLSAELETLVTQPRQRASLLVRRLDALEALRRHAELHARHLDLEHPGLLQHLDGWAARIDAALCARIVA